MDTRHHCAARHAAAGAVTVLPPGVAHNSYPAARAGQLRKRGLGLDRDFLPAGLVGSAVDRVRGGSEPD
jgi:hypothetical protein